MNNEKDENEEQRIEIARIRNHFEEIRRGIDEIKSSRQRTRGANKKFDRGSETKSNGNNKNENDELSEGEGSHD